MSIQVITYAAGVTPQVTEIQLGRTSPAGAWECMRIAARITFPATSDQSFQDWLNARDRVIQGIYRQKEGEILEYLQAQANVEILEPSDAT